MPVQALKCKECDSTYPLDARYVCEHCFGPLEVAYDHSGLDAAEAKRKIQAGPQTIWRYADFLPFAAPPQPGLPVGLTPLQRAPRLAEALGLGEVWIKNDTANPTHSFKDRVVAVALAKAQELGYQVVACASTGNLANAVAAHSAAAGLESYVFIPADLEEQKVLATGVYGTNLVAVRGTYDDVNRLCTEISGERDWAFVNVNVRPYYAEGSKTIAFEIGRAARLRAARPGRGADRVRVAVHQDRARVPGVARRGAAEGRAAHVQRRPGRGLLAGGAGLRGRRDVCRPVKPDTIAKSLAIGNPADGPYALDLARRSSGSIDSVTDDEIRDGIRLLAQTTGIFTETAGRRDHGGAAQAGRARRHRARTSGWSR